MGRKGFPRAEEVVKKRTGGMKLKDIAETEGVAISTVYNAIRSTWSPEDVEEFRKQKTARLERMISQQMEIQERPDMAERIAMRFGANQIRALQDTIDKSEGRYVPDTLVLINANITNLHAERRKLEEELKKLTGGKDAVIEGEIAEGSVEEHQQASP